MPEKIKRLKSIIGLVFITLYGSASAQQLYSKMGEVVPESAIPLFVLPDSSALAIVQDSVLLTANDVNASALFGPTCCPGIVWASNINYNFSQGSIYTLDLTVLSGICVNSGMTSVTYRIIVPPVTEVSIGLLAATSPSGKRLIHGTPISGAALYFSSLVSLGEASNC